MLIGIFFEDINYAAMVVYMPNWYKTADSNIHRPNQRKESRLEQFLKHGVPTKMEYRIPLKTADPIHPNNKHYVVLDIREKGEGLINEGFSGIRLKQKQIRLLCFLPAHWTVTPEKYGCAS